MKDLNSIYRPKSWDSVKGQSKTVDVLKKAVGGKTGLSNAYIFAGKSGIGKTTIARIFFNELNNGDMSDLLEVNASDTRGIEDMREVIKSTSYAPNGNYRGVLLDEAHMLLKPSWNCLLKPLEEASQGVIWLICTTELIKIPKTIQTRCQKFNLNPLRWRDIMEGLKPIVDDMKIGISEEDLWAIARNSDNNLRQAVHLLEQYSITGDLASIFSEDINVSLLEAMAKGDLAGIWTVLNSWDKQAPDINTFLNRVKYDLATVLKIKLGLPVSINQYRLEKYKELEAKVTEEDVLIMLGELLKIEEKTSGVYDYNSLFLNALYNFKKKI